MNLRGSSDGLATSREDSDHAVHHFSYTHLTALNSLRVIQERNRKKQNKTNQNQTKTKSSWIPARTSFCVNFFYSCLFLKNFVWTNQLWGLCTQPSQNWTESPKIKQAAWEGIFLFGILSDSPWKHASSMALARGQHHFPTSLSHWSSRVTGTGWHCKRMAWEGPQKAEGQSSQSLLLLVN